MTKQEYKNIRRVCGKSFKKIDIPAYIRKRELDTKLKKGSDCSAQNPLGGTLEPYDIEREKEMLLKIERKKFDTFNGILQTSLRN